MTDRHRNSMRKYQNGGGEPGTTSNTASSETPNSATTSKPAEPVSTTSKPAAPVSTASNASSEPATTGKQAIPAIGTTLSSQQITYVTPLTSTTTSNTSVTPSKPTAPVSTASKPTFLQKTKEYGKKVITNTQQNISDLYNGKDLASTKIGNESQFNSDLEGSEDEDKTKFEKFEKFGSQAYGCTVRISNKNAISLKSNIIAILNNARDKFYKNVNCSCDTKNVTDFKALIDNINKFDVNVKNAKKDFLKFASSELENLMGIPTTENGNEVAKDGSILIALAYYEKIVTGKSLFGNKNTKVVNNIRGLIVGVNFVNRKLKVKYNLASSKPNYHEIKFDDLCVISDSDFEAIEKVITGTTEKTTPVATTGGARRRMVLSDNYSATSNFTASERHHHGGSNNYSATSDFTDTEMPMRNYNSHRGGSNNVNYSATSDFTATEASIRRNNSHRGGSRNNVYSATSASENICE